MQVTTILQRGWASVARVVREWLPVKELKTAVTHPQQEADKFSKAFQNTPVGMCIRRSADGTYLEVNEAFLKIIGYSLDEVIGKTPLELNLLLDSSTQALVMTPFNNFKPLSELELNFRHKSGHIGTALLSTDLIEVNGEPCYFSTVQDITNRVEIERALEESQHRFQMLAENLPGVVYLGLYEQAFQPLYLNNAIEMVLGYPKEMFLEGHLTLIGLIHPDDAPLVSAMVNRAVKAQTSFHLHYRIQHRQGHWLWIEEFGVIVWENNQLFLEGFLCDITDRYQAEIALTRQAAEMTALYETSLNLGSVCELEELLNIIIERAVVMMKGHRGLLALVTKDGQEMEFVAAYNASDPEILSLITLMGKGITTLTVQTGEPLVIPNYREWELRTDLPDHQASGRVLGVPLKYGDELIGVITVFDNEPGEFTSEQVQLLSLFTSYAAVALQNSHLFHTEQRQRAIAETLLQVGLTVNSSLDVNEVLNRILDELKNVIPYDAAHITLTEEGGLRMVAAQQLEGEHELLGRLISLERLHLSKRTLASGRPWLVPETRNEPLFRISHKSSARVRCLIFSPLIHRGESIGILTVISYTPYRYTAAEMDVAFQFGQQVVMAIVNARLLEQTRQYNLELEERVAERTRELAEAKEAAESANRAKGIFLANMSHELRTPLNAILGYTQILMGRDSLPATEKENLQIISQSGQHLLKLINDVLDMSKIEAGKVYFAPNQFDLDQILSTLEGMFSLRAKQQNVRLIITKQRPLPQYIYTDEKKLTQILINLLSNAFKATESGFVELRVCVKSRQHHQINLQFAVIDTGCGIAADEIGRLFEPFVQSLRSSAEQKGFGLGLAISQQLAQVMGGRLTVQSQEGQGTTFTFEVMVTALEVLGEPQLSDDSAYIYEEKSAVYTLPADLSYLSPKWLGLMHQAAVTSDQTRMLSLTQQIEEQYPLEAAAFRQLINSFETHKILVLTNDRSPQI